ncbi:hypothetical protein LOTGIDRAFT_143860 [Lottia gigantea]|uniref:HECT domain-containing protein n=1 Tax=Lottia gigantea TaxID=225164 RepID=V4AI70_LOTGI|nr:hypothetical protein LOTGIDRAFT_143860 [Lottia gigantea]ESO96627.1 hypothetical protein LOTGIDRAFT_143860 [Lottia gigantea]
MPSITIRPADNDHLPTAKTCILRLYIPLYSSKTIYINYTNDLDFLGLCTVMYSFSC